MTPIERHPPACVMEPEDEPPQERLKPFHTVPAVAQCRRLGRRKGTDAGMSGSSLTGAAVLALALGAGAAPAANELGVAVIVGNKEYADRVPAVSYAHNDAEAFKRFVTGRLGFDADNVIDLRDATKSQLEAALGVRGMMEGSLLWRYIDPAGGSDVVVFYSGHGVPGKAGRGYLLPVDSNPDTAELNGYPIDLLYENLGGLRTRSTTVFLDACFSGGSPRGMLIQSASPVYVEADVSGGADMTVLTAASGAQLASWDEEARHGLFTEHLLDGLYGAADADGDGQVTAREAKLHLDRTMTRAARREFGRVQDAGLHGDESAVLSFSSVDGWGSRPLLGPPPAAFTVLVEPAAARIRILNIGPPYQAGMQLPAGSYEVEASAPGYVTKTETVAHGPSATVHRMALIRPGQPFTVVAEPAAAQVRLLDHAEPYQPGMILPPGSYRVQASALGHTTKTETVAHGSSPTTHRMALSRPGQPFTIVVEPAAARVRLLDHAEPYQPSMMLPPGSYRVQASADGYETATESVAHGTSPTVRRMTLRKTGPTAGDSFRDCAECPEMVVLPAGSYRMGSPSYEQGRDEDEGPVHEVTISASFAIGRHEVTVAEFGRFVDATGYSAGSSCRTYEGGEWESRAGRGWRNPGFGQSGRHPVACVNWNDAQAYAAWLSRETGEKYRLPSESEWEYAARAGTATARYWGEGESGQCRHANGADASAKERYSGWTVASCRDGHVHTAPAGSFAANGWGLHDMLGNVWEWTEDCWNGSYSGAPSDGSAWEYGDCARRVLRGGSWDSRPSVLRAADRYRYTTGGRDVFVGFRVARTLAP